jgi:hypothetical protein
MLSMEGIEFEAGQRAYQSEGVSQETPSSITKSAEAVAKGLGISRASRELRFPYVGKTPFCQIN